MSASHFGGVATVFWPQGLEACAGLGLSPLVRVEEASQFTRSSILILGRPAGVGRREEPVMFGRRLPAGVESPGLGAGMLTSTSGPGPHCAMIEVLMDTV